VKYKVVMMIPSRDRFEMLMHSLRRIICLGMHDNPYYDLSIVVNLQGYSTEEFHIVESYLRNHFGILRQRVYRDDHHSIGLTRKSLMSKILRDFDADFIFDSDDDCYYYPNDYLRKLISVANSSDLIGAVCGKWYTPMYKRIPRDNPRTRIRRLSYLGGSTLFKAHVLKRVVNDLTPIRVWECVESAHLIQKLGYAIVCDTTAIYRHDCYDWRNESGLSRFGGVLSSDVRKYEEKHARTALSQLYDEDGFEFRNQDFPYIDTYISTYSAPTDQYIQERFEPFSIDPNRFDTDLFLSFLKDKFRYHLGDSQFAMYEGAEIPEEATMWIRTMEEAVGSIELEIRKLKDGKFDDFFKRIVDDHVFSVKFLFSRYVILPLVLHANGIHITYVSDDKRLHEIVDAFTRYHDYDSYSFSMLHSDTRDIIVNKVVTDITDTGSSIEVT